MTQKRRKHRGRGERKEKTGGGMNQVKEQTTHHIPISKTDHKNVSAPFDLGTAAQKRVAAPVLHVLWPLSVKGAAGSGVGRRPGLVCPGSESTGRTARGLGDDRSEADPTQRRAALSDDGLADRSLSRPVAGTGHGGPASSAADGHGGPPAAAAAAAAGAAGASSARRCEYTKHAYRLAGRPSFEMRFYKFCPNLLNGEIHKDRAPAKESLLGWPRPLPSDRAIPVLCPI